MLSREGGGGEAVVKAGWQLILRVVARGSRERLAVPASIVKHCWVRRRDATREKVSRRQLSKERRWSQDEPEVKEKEKEQGEEIGKPGASKGKQLN